jgi:hypothetical protein
MRWANIIPVTPPYCVRARNAREQGKGDQTERRIACSTTFGTFNANIPQPYHYHHQQGRRLFLIFVRIK